jgi:hypothetical protein
LEWIITELVESTVKSCDWIVDFLLESLVSSAFYAEKHMTSSTAVINFAEIYTVIFSFGVALIVLKFLKKGFDTYVGWDAGDPDSDPLTLVVNFLRALVVAIGAPVLYNWIVSVAEDMIDKVLNVSNMIINLTSPTDLIWNTVSSLGLSMVVFSLILIIMYALLYFQFIMRGIEMLVLRIGMPIACVGLVDSDRGIFAPYMKKFYMNAATVLVQVVLVKLSLMVLAVSNNVIYAVAVAMVANRAPKFLNEFLLMQGAEDISRTRYTM